MDLLLVSDLFNKLADYNVALRFNSEPCYIVARKDDPETSAQLNEAIKKIYAVNPNFGEALFQNIFLLITVTLLYSQNRKVRLYIKMAHLR